MADQMRELLGGLVEGSGDALQFTWAMVSAPFRVIWAFACGRSEVCLIIRARGENS